MASTVAYVCAPGSVIAHMASMDSEALVLRQVLYAPQTAACGVRIGQFWKVHTRKPSRRHTCHRCAKRISV